ncbi:DnaJ domain-containing protein [Mycotypha africana]|uniref:DnaJ domain-containing protein n=1 Tax=Mycotypha africana TaxID=64632 RepID=UPI0023011309|nr:DnaJ domain-containing protein [Mycotypha africana]KAI8971662.1 DnaJ domain-containing protein [Mycotypha africana]
MKGSLRTFRLYSTLNNRSIKRSPWEVLSLKETATTKEIRHQYLKLAKELHPDKRSTGDAARFQELAEAYETLVNPQKRLLYNEYARTAATMHTPPPGFYRPPSYTNAHWADEAKTSYSGSAENFGNNTTIMSLLAGTIIFIATMNFFYFQSSHSAFMDAANEHHFKSTQDLKRARTEAKLFGNDRAVKRVIDQRMDLFRKQRQVKDENEE